jgi:hypothetical protein
METNDFADLRAAAALQVPRVFIDRAALVALLQQLDTRPAAARPIAVRGEYPEAFEECWAAYPKRPGASKAASYKAWAARLKAGATAAEMLAGTRKYAAYVLATRTEPQFVLQPATFYGPGERFASDWTPPKYPTKGPQHGHLRNQNFAAGVDQDGRF